jgi:D-inositol-3-phosphate glycosyltransferase
MIYSSPYPYFRNDSQFSLADANGAGVVQHDLLEQSLEHGICKSAELFLEWVAPQDRKASYAAIQQLTAKYGQQAINLTTFTDLVPGERIGIAKNCDMAVTLMTTRSSLHLNCFPISLITHSLACPNTLQAYTNLCLLAREGDAIIATSQAAKMWVTGTLDVIRERLLQYGVQPAKLRIPTVRVIPIGTHPIRLLDKHVCRDVLGYSDEDIVSLWIGRFNEQGKADLEPLLLLWPEVVKQYPTSKLILAGHADDPAYFSGLQQLSVDLGIVSSLKFMADFTPQMKRILLGSADMFISPVDNVQETFGVSTIEAMMQGLPVIASDWSGYRDIIEHRVTGLLIPTYICWDGLSHLNALAGHIDIQTIVSKYAVNTIVDTSLLLNAICLLSGNPELRRTFGAAGRIRAIRHYAWPEIIQLYGQAWLEQQSQAKAHAYHLDKWTELDVVSLFKPYATMEIDPRWLLSVTAAGGELLHRGLEIGEEALNALNFFSAPASLPPTIGKGTAGFSQTTALWLLKKGFLAVVKE